MIKKANDGTENAGADVTVAEPVRAERAHQGLETMDDAALKKLRSDIDAALTKHDDARKSVALTEARRVLGEIRRMQAEVETLLANVGLGGEAKKKRGRPSKIAEA